MNEALRVYSWSGILVETVEATEIKSRADARKLAPFADFERHRVTWVRWSQIARTGRWRRAHFRHLPKPNSEPDTRRELNHEFERQESAKAESSEHSTAKEHLALYLRGLLAAGRSLRWALLIRECRTFLSLVICCPMLLTSRLNMQFTLRSEKLQT